MESLGTGPSSALDSTYGAMLIGVLFATFFQGLLSVQVYNYYESYPRDRLLNKITVAVVWCLDMIHLVLIWQSIYHYLVTNWGYQPALIQATWELCVQLAFVGLSVFACQLFFLMRIWIFSEKNIFIAGLILALCLTTLGLHILVIVQILRFPFLTEFGARKTEIIAVFTCGAATDILIASFVCYYLQRTRSDFETTRSVIGKIVWYTVATGLATSALGIAALIAYFARPQAFYYIAIHLCLGRMYSNALLATLNIRQKMRMVLHPHSKQNTLEWLALDMRNAGIARYISPFQAGSNKTNLDSGPAFTYTIERVTDNDGSGISLHEAQGKAPFCST